MKALLAFSSGGGSGFPGSPVAGVYLGATAPEFLANCAVCVAVIGSVVVDAAKGGIAWYSDGSQMLILGGSVSDVLTLATVIPGTFGGVDFQIYSSASLYNADDGLIYNWNGAAWIALN